MANTITTLQQFDQFLRRGGVYTAIHHSLAYHYTLWFQDGRFYVQREGEPPQPFTTVGSAVVALLFALGMVEVEHA